MKLLNAWLVPDFFGLGRCHDDRPIFPEGEKNDRRGIFGKNPENAYYLLNIQVIGVSHLITLNS